MSSSNSDTPRSPEARVRHELALPIWLDHDDVHFANSVTGLTVGDLRAALSVPTLPEPPKCPQGGVCGLSEDVCKCVPVIPEWVNEVTADMRAMIASGAEDIDTKAYVFLADLVDRSTPLERNA